MNVNLANEEMANEEMANKQKANKTSQELRMLSRSLSNCKSLLLNLNLSLNHCLCSDCSDCSGCSDCSDL